LKLLDRNNTLLPGAENQDSIRSPTTATWLENVALRDLAIHQGHAACVDARGDLYQWGTAFDAESAEKPSRTLKGKVTLRTTLIESVAESYLRILCKSSLQTLKSTLYLPLGTFTP